jgi:cytochrome c oxidase cbb3-type subunit IV
MELNLLRSLVTLISFAVFAGIVYWAFNSRNRARFDEAANLPFESDDNDDAAAVAGAAKARPEERAGRSLHE